MAPRRARVSKVDLHRAISAGVDHVALPPIREASTNLRDSTVSHAELYNPAGLGRVDDLLT